MMPPQTPALRVLVDDSERDTARRSTSSTDREAFETWARGARDLTDATLARALDERARFALEVGAADARILVEEIRALSLRGGKRIRAILLAATYEACGGAADLSAIAPALAAVELLQTYLLIHDDWMDGDDVRRGGPSVHASLRTRYGSEHQGNASAILAGDLAAAFSLEELARCAVPPERMVEAVVAFARMQSTVVLGQQLDICRVADDPSSLERVHDLKTGSYTVRGPVGLGAILAGAAQERRAAFDAFARPLGIAFQLRDDLLGTFGNPTITGKPAGGDHQQGKRTALVVDMLAQGGADRAWVERLLAGPAPSSEGACDIAQRMVDSGAKARVEQRLAEQIALARAALARVDLPDRGARLLHGVIAAVAEWA